MIPILATGGSEEGARGLGFISIPELAIIIGVASMSYSLIIIQKLVKHKETPPYLVNGISMFYGGLLALGASSAFESSVFVQQQEPVIKQGILPLIGILSLQILISNILCQNLRASLLKHYSSTFMSFASFLGPVFTSIYGYFLFGEEITWQFLASFSIVLAGLGIYHYDDHLANKKHQILDTKK
jgi:drug/metabolite transporter (DMT)-like permease